ncbi:DUF1273 domain-containing protein [Lactobacillus sp. PV034]|uniref:DUF1273 domain-containing protein n=1 Tax=Lactobacillus sp. PV034 TaxID=2594495 RepID=UPI00223F9FD0|nr:DUF1273 domain-containing protein [Lactobacillus sp. PV034]QNQ80413.1 DUF1273 domain-containing protein [Lactobacillus sp. PV034]
MKRLWVSGYRSYELGIFNQKDKKIEVIKYALRKYFLQKLESADLDWIISGPNLGVEQWALEEGVSLRSDYSVHVSMISPYLDFSKRWNENNQLAFNKLKDKVDFFGATSNSPYQNPGQLRNYQNFMLQHTDEALLIYDPEHPGKTKYDYDLIKKFQDNHAYQLTLLDFYDLQDLAEEYEESLHSDF